DEQEGEKLGSVRALRVDERALGCERVRRAESPVRVERAVPGARALDGEPARAATVDAIEARGEVALPRQVIGRVRRRDLDREVRREALHDRARVSLGAARDVAVPLNDDEQARAAQFATRSTS